MAPSGGGKRKRGDRTYSHDSSDGSRPSPHRPGNLSLAQPGYQYQMPQHHGYARDQQEQRGRGGRRASRGGRGGPLRSPLDSPNAIPLQSRQAPATSKAMSPPPAPIQRSNESAETSFSRALPPVTTSATQTPLPVPLPAPSLYFYEFVTDEVSSSWSSGGRTKLIETTRQACREEDELVLATIFQELIRSGLDGRLDPLEAGSIVKDVLGEQTQNEALDHALGTFSTASVFLNCLSVLTESDSTTASLQAMVLSTGISPIRMREELSTTLLEQLGLIRNTFDRIGIRRQTNLLYRQSNYNLLREETEGYSKLVTELFTTSSNEPPTAEVVEDTFERVKAMIGAFDLDVGRVLDVTLDVFAAVLVKQYRFFVKYLRVSCWWPQQYALDITDSSSLALSGLPKWALPENSGWGSQNEEERSEIYESRAKRDTDFWQRVREIGVKAFFEIGGRRAGAVTQRATSRGGKGDEVTQVEEDRQWIEKTGTLPPPGNKTAAQILGFKLRFYCSSVRDSNDILPVNIIYLAALLIKIGFISLHDLYPHLWPADEDMEKVKEQKMKEKLEREKLNRPGGGAMNALMTAGALADDTIPSHGRLREIESNRGLAPKVDITAEKVATPAKVEPQEELPEPVDQKVQLLRSLLCIGAIPESLYILGQFPWLPDAFPDLPEHIHRILHHSISKVYEPLRPLSDHSDLREQHKYVDPDQSGVPKGNLRQTEQLPRKILRWAQIDKDDTNEGTDYRFYWDDWADNVPICQSVDDVFSLCGTLLNFTGVKIGQDPALLVKLARIGSYSLANDPSESNKLRWIDLSKRLLVPALSLTKSNPGVVTEVFELIKQFSTTTRYSIYAEWYSGSISRLPDIKTAFDQVRAETKDVLKRISKTNVKPMARALAKVATASPGIVFSVAIAQIESYDNLVEVVVECARYFTYLGYDVLTWSIMSSLGTRGRNRVQADGMLTSKWLAALSLFTGKVFKRYAMMSPTPILQYVTEQLRKGNSTDLIVLEEITSSMAGIVSDTNFNEAQVLAMAGGDVLQAQTMLQLLDRRHESASTGRRLLKSLVEPKLAGQLLISIAQERQTCIFKIPEPDAHLKLLGNLFDEIHRVLTQYLDLLRSRLSVKEFDGLVPQVSQLIGDFGIDPSVAFWISRPSIAAEMKAYDIHVSSRVTETKESSTQQSTDLTDRSDVEMAEADAAVLEPKLATPPGGTVLQVENNDASELDVVMKDASQTEQSTESSHPKTNGLSRPWHPVLQKLMDEIRPRISSHTWQVLSEPFYLTFWQLSLGDMMVPTQSYEDEINRKKKNIAAINADRTDMTILGIQKKEREKKMLNEVQDQLRSELKEQVSAYQQTRLRLQKEKEYWFVDCWGKWDLLNIALLEHCFFPRILLSPVDAIYTFKMLKLLHSSGAKNFRTMGLLDQLFNGKRLTPIFFLCTAKEAENVGRFLNEVLKDLGRWHSDKAVFEKEAYGPKKDLPGFSKKMTDDKTILAFWDYEDFRRVLQKWHMNLHTALKTCFTGGEYMHIRNAIVVLKAVFLHFPVINWMGQAQVASITELTKSESREDLKIAATSLLGNLRRREKDWVLPQAFNLNKATPNGASGTRSTSAKPTTPQPENEGSKMLNAQALEFKPIADTNANGTTKESLPPSCKSEVEDGEINDLSMANTAAKVALTSKTQETIILGNANVEDLPIQEVDPGEVEQSQDQTPVQELGLPAPETSRDAIPSSDLTESEMFVPRAEVGAVPSHQSVPSRPIRSETNRNTSEPAIHARPPHGLPSRPEPLPAPTRTGEQRFSSERHGERGPRDSRDMRYSEHGRTDRPNDPMRDRVGERHVGASYPRGYDRPPDRIPYDERNRLDQNWGESKGSGRLANSDRHNGPPSRDSRPATRDERADRDLRDRPYPEQVENMRNTEQHGRSSRDHSMGPPRSGIPQHPDRVALIHGPQELDRDHPSLNPDRRAESSRYEGHSNSQRGSRTSSPSRREDHRSLRHEHPGREDHPTTDSRRGPEDIPSLHQARYEDSRPPTGPRTDRFGDAPSNGQSERFRETLRVPPSNSQPSDPNHGRLNQGSSNSARQQDPQYGRLNPEVPSGPRMSNGVHGPPTPRSVIRNVSAPQPPINTHISPTTSNSMSSPSMPDRQTPTGPSNRAPPRNSAPFTRPPPASTSTPSTPVTETPDVTSVHPDRLKAIQGPNVDVNSTSARTGSHAVNATVTNSLPAGARGPNAGQPPSPINTSRSAQGPPTGPSFPSNERNRGDKRFAGIQNVLQQAGAPNGPDRSSQGTSIRGRGSRANNLSNNVSSPATSGPPTPLMARQDQPPMRQDSFPPARADLFANRNSSGPNSSYHGNEEPDYNRGGWKEGQERRSTRHHESRSHSHDGHAGANLQHQHLPPVGRDNDRSSRRGEEQGRDLRGRGGSGTGPPPPMEYAGREGRRGGRDMDMGGKERDRRGEGERREMEDWDAGRGRGGGERRDERERREGGPGGREGGPGGRKRERGGEEGGGMGMGMGFEGKRSRRGA